MTGSFQTWDDYFIPGTEVLRNLIPSRGRHGVRDPDELDREEVSRAWIRIVELASNPIVGSFDYDHFKRIHRHIFQDVYAWAGEPRVGPATRMTKSGPDVVNYSPGDPAAPEMSYAYYPAGPEMEQAAERQFNALAELLAEPGTDAHFLRELAEVWAELNVAHPFREGNTRTQVVFFSQVLEHVGLALDAAALGPGGALREEFVAARFYSQATGSSARLAAVLASATARLTSS